MIEVNLQESMCMSFKVRCKQERRFPVIPFAFGFRINGRGEYKQLEIEVSSDREVHNAS